MCSGLLFTNILLRKESFDVILALFRWSRSPFFTMGNKAFHLCFFRTLVWKISQSKGCLDYGFTNSPACIGKRGTNYQVGTISNTNRAGCAVDCYHHKDCVLFFYNTVTQACTLHSQLLPYITLSEDQGSSCYQSKGMIAQWIWSIVSASYGGTESYPVGDMVGDTTGHFDSSGNSEVITYRIYHDAYITKLEIDEADGRRPFGDVSVLKPDGSWLTVWGGTNMEGESAQRITTANLMVIYFRTKEIRFNIKPVSWHEGIKAIKTYGKL